MPRYDTSFNFGANAVRKPGGGRKRKAPRSRGKGKAKGGKKGGGSFGS